MCTALIYRNPEKNYLGVGFNRDESVKRGPAREPEKTDVGGVFYLSPIDGDFGGTWIGVNSHFQIYAVLNFYEANMKILRNPTSRGLLLKKLLSEETHISALDSESLKTYYPFRILRVSVGSTDILVWNGEVVTLSVNTDIWKVYASSFLLGNGIEEEREDILRKNFLQMDVEHDFLDISKRFLSCHLPEKGPHSPCMHRREARTVSNTLVVIDDKQVQMYYKNNQPCESINYSTHKL